MPGPAEVLAAVDVQAVQGGDPGPDVLGEVGVVVEGAAVLRHLAPPAVQGGMDQYGGAGGAEQVLALFEDGRVHQIAL